MDKRYTWPKSGTKENEFILLALCRNGISVVADTLGFRAVKAEQVYRADSYKLPYI